MKELPDRFLSMAIWLTISEILNHSQDQLALLCFSPSNILPSLSKFVTNDADYQSLENMISYPKKLQRHRFSTKIASDNATDLIAQAPSDRDAARLRSLQELEPG